MYGLSEDIIKNVKTQSLIDAVLWWQDCRETHTMLLSNGCSEEMRLCITKIKSAAKKAVLSWKL